MAKQTRAAAPLFPLEAVQAPPQGDTAKHQGEPLPQQEVKPPGGPIAEIAEIVGALCDPLIVFPGTGWEESIPQALKDRLPLDRLAHNMMCLQGKARWDEACDLEALLYLFPATLAFPVSEQWTRIYLYLGTKVMGDKIPEDIRQESLSDYDMEELRRLKRWIRNQKVKARTERRRGQKVEKGEAVAAAAPEQFKMF